MTGRFAAVALPLPIADPYTYRVPDTLADRAVRGARVVVPVRRQELVGIVLDPDADAPPGAVEAKPLLAMPDEPPVLTPSLLRTAEWIAGYYGAPIGLTLKAMLPGGLWGRSRAVVGLVATAGIRGGQAAAALAWLERRGGEGTVAALGRALGRPAWEVVDRLLRVGAVTLRIEPADTSADRATERVLALSEERPTLLERARIFGRAPRQRQLYEALEALGGASPVAHLRDRLKFGDGVMRGLVTRGLASVVDAERVRDPFAEDLGTPPPTALTPPQAAALDGLETLPAGEAALLFGVTGSGKTLVYLEAIRRAVAAGQGAIVLVPEIGLTPQTVSRVRGVFGDQVAVLHSALSDGERADAWRLVRRGERRVVVGARSAVFAPVSGLGVIVVDEEHEASYKNGETPRYHARDVAAVRARLEGARLILGSATPSLDTVAGPRPPERRLALPMRIGDRPLPPVEVVDLRDAPRVPGVGALPWSEALDGGVAEALGRGEQVLLLLNRRGFAAFLQCPDCGVVATCERCSISLTIHRNPSRLRCHYCGYAGAVPEDCAACGHAVQRMRGVGTQQLERMLAERFPTARLARMDLDTTSTKWAHHRILEAVGRGEVDLLLGTQMIAKGLDFPNVTLVGVVDADTALHLPDFRSAERTFQLLAQVAGRAGRGPKGGRVLIQTRNPEHHAIRWAARHDAEGFLAEELTLRRSPPYPPVVGLVNLVVSGNDEVAVGRSAARLAEWCEALVSTHNLALTVLGPAPCPLARIKDRWRWHVALKGDGRPLGQVVRYAARRFLGTRDPRVIIDRDPVSLL